jgi:S1/P1 Nuclease
MRFLVSCLLIWSMTFSPALAWNATGHKIIASIAFRRLSRNEQVKVVAILKRHPRFTEDFAEQMPEEVRNGNEAMQNEWLFQQAAVWPDLVRGGPPERRAFNRGEWHYVNLPHFLTDAAKAQLQGKLTVNTETNPPINATLDTAGMNVIQTIRFARRVSADKQSSPQDRAVMLSWVFHTVGDIHQPLYAVAMFSPTLFPSGDRGGNSVRTRQSGNLHSLWDGFPGRDEGYRGARNRAIAYDEDDRFARLGKAAATLPDVITWRDESYDLAQRTVYDDEVLGALRKMEAGSGRVEEIALSETYLKNGGHAVEPRLVQAGYRLGMVLRQIVAE